MDTKDNQRKALLEELSAALGCSATGETRLIESGLWDSLTVMALMAAIDSICGIAVDGEALYACDTVADVLELVEL